MSADLDRTIGPDPAVQPSPSASGARASVPTLERLREVTVHHDPSHANGSPGAAGMRHANGDPGSIRSADPGPIRSADASHGCTSAQLRRFVKSRAYVPMHELRRRFELNGEADDVSPVGTQLGIVYLGLPPREAQLIGELVRQGEVGLELCRDPRVPIVVGVFPIRPITRQ